MPSTDELDLSGRWRAGIADEELRRTWYSDDFDDSDFVDVDVPGHWRRHPAFADNDEPLLYRRRFATLTPTGDTRAWLHLDGVCTQGDVWLDDIYLGNTDGAWVPHRFDITDALATRNEHVVGIEVASPPLGDRSNKSGLLGTWQDGPYVEPGWNPGGIWRPVRIRRTGPVTITSHRVLCLTAGATRATVQLTCTLDSLVAGQVTIRTTVAEVDHERLQPLAAGANTVTWTVDVPDPPLWWPAELGDQPLVDVTVTVSRPTSGDDDPGSRTGSAVDGVEGGHDAPPVDFDPSDAFATKCGLRQVSLRDWILSVNGERLFMRGVLAGPATHDLGTADDEVFTRQVARAADAGANLVRVHAHLSADALYAEADRVGMLVWQDLPLYRGQNRSVRPTALRTAKAMVDRLGGHPSIALWCGHDEPDHVDGDDGPVGFGRRLAAHQLPNWSRSVLDRSVKHALTAADPSRPVIGSSGTWPHPPAFAGTDTHLDLGWSSGEPEDLTRLARTIPRAVRAVQITPSPSSTGPRSTRLRTNWPPDDVADLLGDSPVDHDVLAGRLPPEGFDSFDDWQRATCNYQALLLRTQIEALRRLKYRPTGGFVVAHLDDLRPVMSPSLVDATGTPKPALATMSAVCAPVLVTLDPWPACTHPGETLTCAVDVISDLRAPIDDARVDVRVDWDGGSREWSFGGVLAADSCIRVGRIALQIPGDADRITARVRLDADGDEWTNAYTAPVHIH